MNTALFLGFGILWAMLPLRFLPMPLSRTWRESKGREWNYRILWIIFSITFLCNLVLAPGFVYRPFMGESLKVIMGIQFIFLIRILFARLRHETGPAWMVWIFVIWTSPWWIAILLNLVLMIHMEPRI